MRNKLGGKTVLTSLMLASLLLTTDAAEQNLHIGHCLAGCPLGAASDNSLMIRSVYAMSFNNQNLAADWAAYELSSGSVGIASSLSRAVLADPFSPQAMSEQEFDAIEENSEFDRSYLVPLVNFSATPFWQETNYLTNMVLRSRNLNRGAWYGLEWAIRNLVSRQGSLYVLSGPIYQLEAATEESIELRQSSEESFSHLPPSRQRIPAAYFQIVANVDGAVSAFLFPQQLPVHIHHCERRVTVTELERLTGLEFFPQQSQWPVANLDQGLGCQ